MTTCHECGRDHVDPPLSSPRRRLLADNLRIKKLLFEEAGMQFAAAASDDKVSPIMLRARLNIAAKEMYQAHLQLVDAILDESTSGGKTVLVVPMGGIEP